MFNFEYKKSLGQNFLKDNNIVEKIVDSVDYKENNLIIEIGPGGGALSKLLLKKADYAVLYEIDTRLEKILKKELEGFDNYEIIFDDFLKRNIQDDLSKYDFDNLYIVANLPYYITTPIIGKIISEDIDAKEIVIMIQKEVADRLAAEVGSKEYGQLTVFLRYFYEIKKIMNVSKNSFIPKPKVDSSVIKMIKRENREYLKDLDVFKKLVKDSFRFKRKTLKNNLINYDLDVIQNVLNKYGFSVDMRGECIPYNVFVEIANAITK